MYTEHTISVAVSRLYVAGSRHSWNDSHRPCLTSVKRVKQCGSGIVRGCGGQGFSRIAKFVRRGDTGGILT